MSAKTLPIAGMRARDLPYCAVFLMIMTVSGPMGRHMVKPARMLLKKGKRLIMKFPV